jgi:hypothetical protein
LEILLHFFFCFPMLLRFFLWFSWSWSVVFMDCYFVETTYIYIYRIKVDWHVSFLSPLFSLTYLYHWYWLLYKLLNIICTQSTFFFFFVLISVMTFLLLK